jgi:N-acetyl-gamma-glutamyl-phosphate reductase
MADKIKVGIIGAAGFTGGELIRILINHPFVDIVGAHSRSQAGDPVFKTHKDLLGETDLIFSDQFPEEADMLFLCMGHGESKKFLEQQKIRDDVKIIDLSHDFRISPERDQLSVETELGDFVYGLPELNRDKINKAQLVANPGCFATCLQLALLPLAHQEVLKQDIHVSATTGSTGAGQKLVPTNGFTWRVNNLSTYKTFTHQHLREVNQMIGVKQSGSVPAVHFVPYRGNFTRGIIATCYTPFQGSTKQAVRIFTDYYEGHPFTHLSEEPLDLKMVVNTNKCFIHVEVVEGQVVITSIIDNLLKGASGQAVQNMNLMFGLDENSGLRLKASAF